MDLKPLKPRVNGLILYTSNKRSVLRRQFRDTNRNIKRLALRQRETVSCFSLTKGQQISICIYL